MKLGLWAILVFVAVEQARCTFLKFPDRPPPLNYSFDYAGQSSECEKFLSAKGNELLLVQMLDASSKPPSGILVGHVTDLGSYDQCLGIDGTVDGVNILGKYCGLSASLSYKGLGVRLSLCIPNVCDVNKLSISMGSNVAVAVRELLPCVTKYTRQGLAAEDWVMVGVLAALVAVIAAATMWDIKNRQENLAPSRVVAALSLRSNGDKLFAVSNNPEMIHCLNGLRVISMLWIVAAHRFSQGLAMSLINTVDAMKFMTSNSSFYLGGAYVAVDTFFFMSSFLLAYMYFKKVDRNPIKVGQVPALYLHRFLRILPPLVALYFMELTLFRRMGEGPMAGLWENFSTRPCREHWWSFFLFIQNYVNYNDMCLSHTWYLAADMQMFLISPFIILPMGYLIRSNKKKFAYIFCIFLILVSILVPMAIHMFIDNENEYATHARLGLYIIGLLMGLVIIDLRNSKYKMGFFLNWTIWIIVLAVMLIIVFYTHDVKFNDPSFFKTNLFASLAKPLWGLGLCWVVYSCTMGHGGLINWFLSLPIFQILGRICYCMYLVHFTILLIYAKHNRISNNFSFYDFFYMWCGDIVISTFVSFCWVLVFEMPSAGLEAMLFSRGPQKPKTGVQTIQKVEEKTAEP